MDSLQNVRMAYIKFIHGASIARSKSIQPMSTASTGKKHPDNPFLEISITVLLDPTCPSRISFSVESYCTDPRALDGQKDDATIASRR